MRAGSSTGFAVVLAMIAASGCAPFLADGTGPTSEGLYRAKAPAAAADGMYGDAARAAEETASPAVEAPAAPAPAPALEQEPAVFVVRTSRCCPGPLVVTVACADSSGARDDTEPPPPPPYKPWPGHSAPSLYHDR